MNDEIWQAIRHLEQALVTKSPNIRITTTGGKIPMPPLDSLEGEVDFSLEENPNVPYMDEGTPHIIPWKPEDATFKNTKCNHVYSAQTEICIHCKEHRR